MEPIPVSLAIKNTSRWFRHVEHKDDAKMYDRSTWNKAEAMSKEDLVR